MSRLEHPYKGARPLSYQHAILGTGGGSPVQGTIDPSLRRTGSGKGSARLPEDSHMARVCVVTGKRPMSGNNVSHAHNKTKRRFYPNLQDKRFWSPRRKRWVKLRVSTKGIKIMNRRGVDRVLDDLQQRGVKF